MLSKEQLQEKTREELIKIVLDSKQEIIELQQKLNLLLAQKHTKQSEKNIPPELDEPEAYQEEQQEIAEVEEEITVAGHTRKKIMPKQVVSSCLQNCLAKI